MRILAVADVESAYYYDYYVPGKLDGLDLILSCGDLGRAYLEFLTTLAPCPVVYVRGNHDEGLRSDPPGGCECAEDRIWTYRGVRILGLGGSFRYRTGSEMYTEEQMRRRIRRLSRPLKRSGGFDILLTHAPARELGDLDDLPHRGFACFGELLETYRPRFFVHGHVHRNYALHVPQKMAHGPTTIVNAFDHCVFEYDDP